ncbi:hypothetical protein [Neorhodopirellula lusitana]|uniref:hypothetical protein n=1 Tax=Neorhodopirellula lusitana TaxID=445327 RepID=UPI00384FA51C
MNRLCLPLSGAAASSLEDDTSDDVLGFVVGLLFSNLGASSTSLSLRYAVAMVREELMRWY